LVVIGGLCRAVNPSQAWEALQRAEPVGKDLPTKRAVGLWSRAAPTGNQL